MNTALITAIVSACLLAALWIGMRLRRFLPEHHLSPHSRKIVELAMGLVATMSALLLGLLVNSTKTSYDTTRIQVMQKASKYALLDRLLVIYGPRAAEVRGQLPALIEESTRRMWPHDDADIPAQLKRVTELGNAFYVAVLRLEARDDTERALKAQAVSLTLELGQLNSLMEAQSTTSVSKPMLVVVVLWLVDDFPRFQSDRTAKRHCQLRLDRLGFVRGWRDFSDSGAGSAVRRTHANLQRTDAECVAPGWEIATANQ
jgi:hypothetical protein